MKRLQRITGAKAIRANPKFTRRRSNNMPTSELTEKAKDYYALLSREELWRNRQEERRWIKWRERRQKKAELEL